MVERIQFDEQDRDLFRISDLRLRADAIKHSVLPRLQRLMNICIDMIRDAYGVETLDDSIISLSPNFRTKRAQEIRVAYQWASVSLGGKRKSGMWPRLVRKDGKPVQIVPYLFGFDLTADGLVFSLVSHPSMRLAEQSKRKLIVALHRHAALIAELRCIASVEPVTPVMTEADRLKCQLDKGNLDLEYWGEMVEYPVTESKLQKLAFNFVMFFPIYDLCLCHAKGEPDRFNRLIDRANTWLMSLPAENDDAEAVSAKSISDPSIDMAATSRVKVMPALRWQVFQRDGWKCVACGRQSHDGVLLHVDHVLPRSKGGKDVLANLQTLCSECNIGKGNRDATNLRART